MSQIKRYAVVGTWGHEYLETDDLTEAREAYKLAVANGDKPTWIYDHENDGEGVSWDEVEA